jgi:hypothetical protein
MTKLDSDTAPQSGKGSDQQRLSQSPQSLRRGGADPTDISEGTVTKDAGQRNYDANPRQPYGTDPWATGAGE